MAISVRLSDEDTRLIKTYAKTKGMSVSEFARESMLDRIEDEYDIEYLQDIVDEYEREKATGTLRTYSHKELWEMLGI